MIKTHNETFKSKSARRQLSWKTMLCTAYLILSGFTQASGIAQNSDPRQSQSQSQNQYRLIEKDPRELSLDIFSSLKRSADPVPIAARLGLLIPVYRFACERVTDYQVFRRFNNLADLKVKCSGQPLYGVTVAANGYSAIYGGNGMIQPFDSRDGKIFSFAIDGAVLTINDKTLGQKAQEAIDLLEKSPGDFNVIYLSLMLLVILAIVGVFMLIWVKALRRRRRQMHRKPGSKTKMPLERVSIAAGLALRSEVKNKLEAESELVRHHIYYHPAGFYLARGKKGRRHLFKSLLGAKLYVRLNWKLYELTSHEFSIKIAPWKSSGIEDVTQSI